MSTNSKMPKIEELQLFFITCKNHDWYYARSESSKVYQCGAAKEQEIRRIAASHPAYHAIFQSWQKYFFSGKTFNTEQAPKPVMPEELC